MTAHPNGQCHGVDVTETMDSGELTMEGGRRAPHVRRSSSGAAAPSREALVSSTDIDTVDAALMLDAMADILELMPPLEHRVEREERADVILSCRKAAQVVMSESLSEQPFEAAKGYGGTEWSNALLRALLGRDYTEALLVAAMNKQRQSG